MRSEGKSYIVQCTSLLLLARIPNCPENYCAEICVNMGFPCLHGLINHIDKTLKQNVII
jgi:hypothetical protein